MAVFPFNLNLLTFTVIARFRTVIQNIQLVQLLLRNNLITLSLQLNKGKKTPLNLENNTMGGIDPGIYSPVQLTDRTSEGVLVAFVRVI